MKLELTHKYSKFNYFLGALFIFFAVFALNELATKEITFVLGTTAFLFFLCGGIVLLSLPKKEYREKVSCYKYKVIKK